MASPMNTTHVGGWTGQSQSHPQSHSKAGMVTANDLSEAGLQARPMGLKVHYTFDKDNSVNCLARSSQTLRIQAIPIDEKTTIGVVDLRTCVQAITECSPELASHDGDYTIYALDYSEEDVPFVGQGMLSWVLQPSMMPSDEEKMVTGRVTRNVMAVFGKGNKETLEVKLKLTAAARVQRPDPQRSLQLQAASTPGRPVEDALTPTGAQEWNNFMHSNPQIGQQQLTHSVASPVMPQSYSGPTNTQDRRESFTGQQPIWNLNYRPEPTRIAPVPVNEPLPPVAIPPATSRPSSRASNKSTKAARKQPTGRPRGRPRKNPVPDGHTSGYEDGTEGEDAVPPARKRAKITQVETKAKSNSFTVGGQESLRVTASTSGSLRNFRPLGGQLDSVAGGHLQDVPRAPTPVPNPLSALPGRGAKRTSGLQRQESAMSQEYLPSPTLPYNDPGRSFTVGDDGRSPDSIVETPVYSGESPAEMRSSPPERQPSRFIRSSPPPSSPVLPPMPIIRTPSIPQSQIFMTDDMELFGDDQAQAAPADLYNVGPILDEQGFRLTPGTGGQESNKITASHTPVPTSMPAGPMGMQSEAALPPLKQTEPKSKAPRSRPKKPSKTRPATRPAQNPALTPPLTTDAAENSVSPAQAMQAPPTDIDPDCNVQPVASPTASARKDSLTQEPNPPNSETTLGAAPQEPPVRANPIRKRGLNRSQSAGALNLPTVAASEPAGPSSLSTVTTTIDTEPQVEVATHPVETLRRAMSTGLMSLPLPASEPPAPQTDFPETDIIPAPSSPGGSRSNKNIVKKNAIMKRLDEAVMNGEMPPFCTNCGAIQTPTWRKIYTQDRDGIPDHCELSEKPGMVTAVDILTKDEDGVPTKYRVIKKSLGLDEEKAGWKEMLLCNPCGIWLAKSKSQRPSARWDKDQDRIGVERRKRGSGSRKRSQTKSDAPLPTSEAYFATDTLEAMDMSPKMASLGKQSQDGERTQSQPGTTHSRGNGTSRSPFEVDLDEQMGSTKRVLFPSPRKEGEVRALGEVSINLVRTTPPKRARVASPGKENIEDVGDQVDLEIAHGKVSTHKEVSDELPLLPRTPRFEQPTTPKRSAHKDPFKTPTKQTPSHRPVTRSVTKSKQSERTFSPDRLGLPPQTPSRSTVRRSPRTHNGGSGHPMDTPISRSISQLFGDNPEFTQDDWSGAIEESQELAALNTALANERLLAQISQDDGSDEASNILGQDYDFSDLPDLTAQDYLESMDTTVWTGDWE